MVVLLTAGGAVGQIFNGQQQAVNGPMDRVAEQHAAAYANVALPGADQDAMSPQERYDEMIDPINKAIDRHYNAVVTGPTVVERPLGH